MEFNLGKLWAEYIKEDTYAHPSDFMQYERGFTEVESDVVGTWRWGNIVRAIYKANDVEYYAVQYKDASGDGDIDADGMHAEFWRVEPKEVTTIKYVKVEN